MYNDTAAEYWARPYQVRNQGRYYACSMMFYNHEDALRYVFDQSARAVRDHDTDFHCALIATPGVTVQTWDWIDIR